MAPSPYTYHFQKQSATFFVYVISLITALTVNDMWKRHFKLDRPAWKNILIVCGMVAVAIALIALITVWSDDGPPDYEAGQVSN